MAHEKQFDNHQFNADLVLHKVETKRQCTTDSALYGATNEPRS